MIVSATGPRDCTRNPPVLRDLGVSIVLYQLPSAFNRTLLPANFVGSTCTTSGRPCIRLTLASRLSPVAFPCMSILAAGAVSNFVMKTAGPSPTRPRQPGLAAVLWSLPPAGTRAPIRSGALRAFRDERLALTILGGIVVRLYRRVGPTLAVVIRTQPWLRRAVFRLVTWLAPRLDPQREDHADRKEVSTR